VTLTIAPIAQLERPAVRDVAALFKSALADYYEHWPLSDSERLDTIVAQLSTPGAELSDAWAAIDQGGVLGAYSALEAERLGRAQVLASAELFRRLTSEARASVRNALRSYREKFAPPPAGSVYLARIAVNPGARRRGVGSRLLDDLVQRAASRPLSLHVHQQNAAARGLYRRHGFVEVETAASEYVLMRRD
jgi:ribosomal protein S18 acetylase RimI-like enzyme